MKSSVQAPKVASHLRPVAYLREGGHSAMPPSRRTLNFLMKNLHAHRGAEVNEGSLYSTMSSGPGQQSV